MTHSVLLIEAGARRAVNVRPALAELALEVTVADSCRSSHEILKTRENFNLALVDLEAHEHGVPGDECGIACEVLKAKCVPFAVMSDRNDRLAVTAAVTAGALGFIPRAAPPDAIVPIIATALARAADLRQLGGQLARMAETLAAKRVLNLATGIVMERFNLADGDAARLLRYFARSHRITLEDAAERIISRSGSLELLAAVNRFVQKFAP